MPHKKILGSLAMTMALVLCLGAPIPAVHANEPASATAPVATPSPAVSTEKVDNPYGLDALWKGGDFVARGTLVILVIMSMGSWYIIGTKFVEQVRLFRHARNARGFWTAGSIQNGLDTLAEGSAFRFIAQTGIEATERHGDSLTASIDLHTWVTMSIQRAAENVQNRLQDGLAFLATVGYTAPFVGLFGTVWGIYHALTAIGIDGQA